MPSNGHQLAELSSQYFYDMKIELDYFNKYPKGNYLTMVIRFFYSILQSFGHLAFVKKQIYNFIH